MIVSDISSEFSSHLWKAMLVIKFCTTSFKNRTGICNTAAIVFGDTITIQTAAGLGMSWNIARDVAGLVFKGTVVSMDTATIDAALDSIKTISIQAYSGTTPVSHWYNQCQLVLSKDHGFIKALEFFIFPNAIAGPDRTGAPFDKTQHLRLPADVMDGAVTLADLNWRYAPGNEWIFWDDNGINPDGSSRSVKVTHDSVLQTNPLTSGSLQVTIKSVHYEKQRIFEAPTSSKPYISYLVSDTSYQLVHTDTISTFSIGLPVYPEVGWRAALKNRYFVRQFCAGKYEVAIRFVDRYYPSFSNPACHRLLGDLSGPEYSRSYQDVLTGFGLTKQFTNALSANGETYHYVRPVYMKLGNCTRGSKINVATLSTGEVNRASAAFTVYPNPANDKLIITTNQPDQRQHVALRSIAGQLVSQQNFTGSSLNIYTADIPAGLYFLEVNGKAVRQTFKVLIQH